MAPPIPPAPPPSPAQPNGNGGSNHLLGRGLFQLAERQLTDIFLSLLLMAQSFCLMLIFFLATLRVTWQIPVWLYVVIASCGLTFSTIGLFGGLALWLRGERHVRRTSL